MIRNTKKIINQISIKSSNPKLIESAFEFAELAYLEKSRPSGKKSILRAVKVASMLSNMNLDATTISLGLLHDILDETPIFAQKIELKEIEKKFGKEISLLLEKLSNLKKARYSLSINIKGRRVFSNEEAENLRRMFLALSGDLRVIIVSLVYKLDQLNSLKYLPENQQKISAIETLQIFAPIARRLGLSEIRRNLEDSAFSYISPKKSLWVKNSIEEQYEAREKYLKKLIVYLKKIFKKERLKIVDINYRAKSYWSTYKKLVRRHMDFNEIYDLLALRVITADVESCYKALGIIHKYFKPISEEINDYIAKPKDNGYRSLHTTVISRENKITEIQIRTEEMHKEAEYGVCAHWSYKDNINLKKDVEALKWSRSIPDFWKTFTIDFFPDKIFCFTPKGDIIVLPKNSTPIDFAYYVHSDIGNHCESAKIGNKIVPLNHILENGDVVEITTNKNKKPSKDWLRFVKTSMAKSHIKKLTDEKTPIFKLPIPRFLREKIAEISEAAKKRREEKKILQERSSEQIYIAGQKGMLIHIAKCCNPKPGDKVKAYLAKNRPTVLHRRSCSVLKKIVEKFPEKVMDASWE